MNALQHSSHRLTHSRLFFSLKCFSADTPLLQSTPKLFLAHIVDIAYWDTSASKTAWHALERYQLVKKHRPVPLLWIAVITSSHTIVIPPFALTASILAVTALGSVLYHPPHPWSSSLARCTNLQPLSATHSYRQMFSAPALRSQSTHRFPLIALRMCLSPGLSFFFGSRQNSMRYLILLW